MKRFTISMVIAAAVIALSFNNSVMAQIIHANNKIDICHYPPGNPDNAHTITISENALATHLAHGDKIGKCEDIHKVDLIKIKAFPNPYPEQVNVEYELKSASFVNIEVYNQSGNKIHTITNENKAAGKYSHNFSAKDLGHSSGMYLVKVTAINEEETFTKSTVIVETD